MRRPFTGFATIKTRYFSLNLNDLSASDCEIEFYVPFHYTNDRLFAMIQINLADRSRAAASSALHFRSDRSRQLSFAISNYEHNHNPHLNVALANAEKPLRNFQLIMLMTGNASELMNAICDWRSADEAPAEVQRMRPEARGIVRDEHETADKVIQTAGRREWTPKVMLMRGNLVSFRCLEERF